MDYILAHKLKIARQMRDLSMEALSRRMGVLVTKQAISKYEQGKIQPTSMVLTALYEVLDVLISYFYKQGVRIDSISFRIDYRVTAKSYEQMLNIISDAYYNNLFNCYIHANPLETDWGGYPVGENGVRFSRLLS